jgi:uncharacterized protein
VIGSGETRYRAVLDTNVIVRALINARSASGRVLKACENRVVIPLLSKPVLAEYRAILTQPRIVDRYPELNERSVRAALERLSYVGDLVRRVAARFDFARDPKDAKFIELAITARATHLITTDDDLLRLTDGRDEASKRFRQRLPSIEVLHPEEFIARHANDPGIEPENAEDR